MSVQNKITFDDVVLPKPGQSGAHKSSVSTHTKVELPGASSVFPPMDPVMEAEKVAKAIESGLFNTVNIVGIEAQPRTPSAKESQASQESLPTMTPSRG